MSLNAPKDPNWDEIESAPKKSTNTNAKVAKNAKSEAEKDGHQTRQLRYAICGAVVLLLFIELIGLFMIVVWQGRGHFHLGEWTFGFMTNGVLIQTFFSFRTIVTHLFPNGAKDFKK